MSVALAVLAIAGLSQKLSAQSSKDDDVVQIAFTVFAQDPLKDIEFIPAREKAAVSVRSYATYRSSVYDYRGPSELKFYARGQSGQSRTPIAVYRIPKGMKRVFLLFSPKQPAGGNSAGYEVMGVDDSLEHCPLGSFTILNVSGATYYGAINARNVLVQQGVSGPFSGQPKADIALNHSEIPTEFVLIAERWPVDPRQRVTVVFFPPNTRGGVMPVIRKLSDQPPLKKKGQSAR